MTTTRFFGSMLLIAGMVFLVCGKREPINPLDPDNPNTTGKAYTLHATSSGIGEIKLHWRKVDQPQVKGYKLYRSVLYGEAISIATVTDTLFGDGFLPPHTAYFYFYRLLWEDGRELHQSPIATAMTFDAPIGLVITKVSRNLVEIQWSDLRGLGNYARCRIYRSSGSEFSLYDSTTANRYADTRVENGVTYRYKVMAVATDGCRSNLSNEVYGTPGNSAPVIDSLVTSQPFTAWGEQVSITCLAHDADDDSIHYSWQALDGGSISGLGKTVTYAVPQDEIFAHRVLVTVSDDYAVGERDTIAIESMRVVLSENFDSYALRTFPSSGEWSLIYSGSGASQQYVDNVHSVSSNQSLHLVGSSCWSANAFHSLSISSKVRLEAKVFVDGVVSCGCTPILAHLDLVNPNLGSWGTSFGMVEFDCDGKIYANQGSNAQNVFLMRYSARTWYQVRLDIDLTARLFDVYIDDVRRASNLRISDNGMPTGVTLCAGHGGNPTVWFDDVKVWGK